MVLAHKQILVTREATQAKEFNQMIEDMSGKVLSAPLLKINPITFKEIHLDDFNWIFFTSANGVDCFLNPLEDTHFLETINIAVDGHKKENALKKYGVTDDFTHTVYYAVATSEEYLKKHSFASHILCISRILDRNA